MLRKIRPHHIQRFCGYLLAVKQKELSPWELGLYDGIKNDPEGEIQVVRDIDDACAKCQEPEKPDYDCKEGSLEYEIDSASMYGVEIRDYPYTHAEFMERIKASCGWKFLTMVKDGFFEDID